jgi:hypothetical protein
MFIKNLEFICHLEKIEYWLNIGLIFLILLGHFIFTEFTAFIHLKKNVYTIYIII